MFVRIPLVAVLVEWKWVENLTRQFDLCDVGGNDSAVVLADATTDAGLVEVARLALQRLGARVSTLTVPPWGDGARGRVIDDPVVIAALSESDFVADCSAVGVRHLDGLDDVLDAGARVLGIGSASPAELSHLVPHAGLKRRVDYAVDALKGGSTLLVVSDDGTELTVDLDGAERSGNAGVVTEPGSIDHWPSGAVRAVPRDDAARGTIVLMPGDIVATFGSFVRSPVTLDVEHDHVCDIEGESGDADLIRAHLESFSRSETYGIASIGWGLNQTGRANPPERFDATHLRAGEADIYAGNVVVELGSNPVADRWSEGGLRLCLRRCSVVIDDVPVVREGVLQGELAPDVYERAAGG